MDSNTTAGGGVDPLLPLDPATTSSALENMVSWALAACVIIGILVSMAMVINYFRGPKEGLEQRQPTVAEAPPAVDVELAQEPVLQTCSVYLSEMADGEAVRVLTACMHCFHSTCVEQWLRLHATCPLCRAPTSTGPAKDHQHPPTT